MLDKTISKAKEIWYKGDFEPNEKDVHFKDGIYDISYSGNSFAISSPHAPQRMQLFSVLSFPAS